MAKFTRYITPDGGGIAEHPSGLLYHRDEVEPVIQRLEAQVRAADALADRVNTWSNDNLTDDNCRDWFGHVEPALAAYRATKEGGA